MHVVPRFFFSTVLQGETAQHTFTRSQSVLPGAGELSERFLNLEDGVLRAMLHGDFCSPHLHAAPEAGASFPGRSRVL